ncbi:MAG: phosphoglucosamine mutase [Gammaproteobacteria bacterium]|uniref:Phosphoglucosamine mutase n=1 Tax=OM182 bacterium MED-G24 TaxID=1986255 RepID=A0A2A5WJI7_9GAMM|nr:phosphoglucosamine mutase [Gammaproteobacteria bacterium]MAV28146.1 phosphoglucosamine mutase [Gammaproteobacteria bacterium]PDH36428.1 MAG: phosphoglucosamine mutase [OM182 bacterium MED-G24]RPG23095.1 MAG: phosphoglucosamine mutase [Gammaproteobacteria bacterium TMED50]|tara:strand:+ start:19862 stop:21184 length:1323 start_codon:yes stop_codon:yes gene_type:complete
MAREFFGTDGIRGRVGEHPITTEFVLKLGWAAGRAFAGSDSGQILIGKDTRLSGYMLESALQAGITSAGIDVRLLGPMPTPAIAYLTRTFHGLAGVVISASHNPFHDNGIKFFSSQGQKLQDDIEETIEHYLGEPMVTVSPENTGKVSRITDAAGRYIEFCKSRFRASGGLEGLRIVVDCAHGATYQIAPNVFSELGADVVSLGVEPDGLNINKDVGSTSPEALRAVVREQRADLGIALDGDGDRVVMVDHNGEVVDGDELVYVIARHRHDRHRLDGGVVGTVMSNLGLEKALQKLDIPFHRSLVGDRYVMADLMARGWILGGESSGHILCLDQASTGDGIVSALQVLDAMRHFDSPLADLKNEMSKHPQRMINVSCDKRRVQESSVVAAVSRAEETLGNTGRVLLRPSGTEPVVRVMVEGEDEVLVNRLCEKLAEVVGD